MLLINYFRKKINRHSRPLRIYCFENGKLKINEYTALETDSIFSSQFFTFEARNFFD